MQMQGKAATSVVTVQWERFCHAGVALWEVLGEFLEKAKQLRAVQNRGSEASSRQLRVLDAGIPLVAMLARRCGKPYPSLDELQLGTLPQDFADWGDAWVRSAREAEEVFALVRQALVRRAVQDYLHSRWHGRPLSESDLQRECDEVLRRLLKSR